MTPQRNWRRRVVALTLVPFAIASGIVGGVSATGTANAGCFQKGGYNPPPCTTSAPVADDGQGADPPPDSGVTACQNQSAMSTSLGLQPTTCRTTQGATTPPDSGVTACQNQSAMSTSLGLLPAACPPSKKG